MCRGETGKTCRLRDPLTTAPSGFGRTIGCSNPEANDLWGGDVPPQCLPGGDAMHIPRRYTSEGRDPFAAFHFVPRTSRISNPDGSVVFEMKDLMAPEHWSQV